jgi:hypothetical protein
MHKNATKCNKTQSKWCINKHGASKIIDTFETYQAAAADLRRRQWFCGGDGFLGDGGSGFATAAGFYAAAAGVLQRQRGF